MASIEEKVEVLLEKKIEELGYELYDVEYAKEGKDYYLRIFIDKPEGITIDDCEKVNDAIKDKLDEEDYIKQQYFLEVSSPGIERILRKDKHLEQNTVKEDWASVVMWTKVSAVSWKAADNLLGRLSVESIPLKNNSADILCFFFP